MRNVETQLYDDSYPGTYAIHRSNIDSITWETESLPQWVKFGGGQCQLPPRFPTNTKRQPNGKKLAYLFMVEDKIPMEDMWLQYFKQLDPSSFLAVIHYSDRNVVAAPNFSHIIIPSMSTRWCKIGGLMINMMRAALEADENIFGAVTISGSHVPLKPADAAWNYLLDAPQSILNFAEPSMSKHATWMFIMRHDMAYHVKKFGERSRFSSECEEEHIWQNERSALHGVITFDCWGKMENDKSKLYKEGPHEYLEIDIKVWERLIGSGALFARKFFENSTIGDGSGMLVKDYIKEKILR